MLQKLGYFFVQITDEHSKHQPCLLLNLWKIKK